MFHDHDSVPCPLCGWELPAGYPASVHVHVMGGVQVGQASIGASCVFYIVLRYSVCSACACSVLGELLLSVFPRQSFYISLSSSICVHGGCMLTTIGILHAGSWKHSRGARLQLIQHHLPPDGLPVDGADEPETLYKCPV